MAKRRMISPDVVASDDFIDLPTLAQCLYIQILLDCDDDGFTARIRSLCRMLGTSREDLQALIDAGFVYEFPSGIVVDMYWGVNNLLRKDRYKPTVHKQEAAMLTKDASGKYVLKESQESQDPNPEDEPEIEEVKPTVNQPSEAVATHVKGTVSTNRQPDGNRLATQVRLGKVRKGKDRLFSQSSMTLDRTKQTPTTEKVNDEGERDEEVKSAVQLYETTVRPIKDLTELERIRCTVQDFGMEAFKRAVEITRKNGGRSLAYVETVIRNPKERRPQAPGSGYDSATEILESGELNGIFD